MKNIFWIAVFLIGITTGAYFYLESSHHFLANHSMNGRQFYSWLHKNFDKVERKSIGQIDLDALTSTDKASLRDQCLVDERDFSKIERQLFSKWQITWKIRSARSFSVLLDDDGSFQDFSARKYSDIKKKDGIAHMQTNFSSKKLDKLSFVAAIGHYLDSYEKIDYVHLIPTEYRQPTGGRSSYRSFRSLEVDLRLELRGRRKDDQTRIVDITTLTASLNRNHGIWQIESIAWKQGTTSYSSRSPSFLSATDQLQLHKIKKFSRINYLGQPGFSLNLYDLNHDGFDDVIIGTQEQTISWRSDSKGSLSYTPHSQKMNVKNLRQLMPLQLGYDARESLVLVHGRHSQKFALKILEYNGHIWQESTAQLPTQTGIVILASFDANRDGRLDLLVGEATTSSIESNPPLLLANQIFRLRLWQQDINGFKDVTEALLPHNKINVAYKQAIAIDADRDGWQDIFVVDDGNGHSSWLHNDQGRGFVRSGQGFNQGGVGRNIAGFSIMDLDHNEHFDMVTVHRFVNAHQRLRTSCTSNWKQSVLPYASKRGGSVKIWQGNKDGRLIDVSVQAQTDGYPYFAQSINKIDYNSDGLVDFYVPTGSWSGQSHETDISSDLTLYQALRYIKPDTRWIDGAQGFFLALSQIRLKELIPGLPAQRVAPSFSGFQPNLLFRNNGDGTFSEVGYHEGVDTLADGSLVAISDLNQDGRPDLILRNQDTSSGKINALVQVFLNVHDGSPSLSINLDDDGPVELRFRHDDLLHHRYRIKHAGNFQNSQTINLGFPSSPPQNFEIVWHDRTSQFEKNQSTAITKQINKRMVISQNKLNLFENSR